MAGDAALWCDRTSAGRSQAARSVAQAHRAVFMSASVVTRVVRGWLLAVERQG